jgi:LuxR family transcriptional regulator of spore coat protein
MKKNQVLKRGVKKTEHQIRRWSLLTAREREVFEMIITDMTTKEIAASLKINEKTVRNHISNVIQKLNVKGRAQAVVELIKLKELKIEDEKKF